MKKYRVLEDNRILLETDDKEHALMMMGISHINRPNYYHELHEWWNGQYNGIRQYKPGDKVTRK